MRMIEKVARAMCEKDGFTWNAPNRNFTANGEEPEQQKEYWIDKARVGLEAMREPNDFMIEAGYDWYDRVDATEESPMPKGVFRSMIDAALSEVPHADD